VRYDIKNTYFITDTIGVNYWSKKPNSRKFMTIYYHYNHISSKLGVEIDTTFYKNDRIYD